VAEAAATADMTAAVKITSDSDSDSQAPPRDNNSAVALLKSQRGERKNLCAWAAAVVPVLYGKRVGGSDGIKPRVENGRRTLSSEHGGAYARVVGRRRERAAPGRAGRVFTVTPTAERAILLRGTSGRPCLVERGALPVSYLRLCAEKLLVQAKEPLAMLCILRPGELAGTKACRYRAVSWGGRCGRLARGIAAQKKRVQLHGYVSSEIGATSIYRQRWKAHRDRTCTGENPEEW